MLNGENHYSQLLIERSVQRVYESRQQNWRETTAKPDQQECLTQQAKNQTRRAHKSGFSLPVNHLEVMEQLIYGNKTLATY